MLYTIAKDNKNMKYLRKNKYSMYVRHHQLLLWDMNNFSTMTVHFH